MSTGLIVVIIVLFLSAAIAVSVYFQIQEKKKAEIRKKIGRCLFRAREAQELLEKIDIYPVGQGPRLVLLKYIEKNYREALSLEPTSEDFKSTLQNTLQRISEPDSLLVNERWKFSQDLEELTVIVNRLRHLGRRIKKINNVYALDPENTKKGLKDIKFLKEFIQIVVFLLSAKENLNNSQAQSCLNIIAEAEKLTATFDKNKPQTQALLKQIEIIKTQAELVSKDSQEKIEKMFKQQQEKEAEEKKKDIFKQKKW